MTDSTQKLRRRFDSFVEQARENELKLRRFQAFELSLIGNKSLVELLQAILSPDSSRFKWDMVSLLLLDHEYEIQRLLEKEGVALADYPQLMFATDSDALEALYPVSLFPAPGPYRSRQHARLFPGKRRAPVSVMLLPLVRHGRLIGSLNIGSFQQDRFSRDIRTDFFEHYAAVVAICIENAANLERLKYQGLTDTLTGVNNRRFFDQRLMEEIETAKRSGTSLVCLLLDVDFFKKVNDLHGHQVGDRVLQGIAALIRDQLRGNDVLARYGGEEFCALLAHTHEDVAIEVAERIRAGIEQCIFTTPAGSQFNVTITIGLAEFDPQVCDDVLTHKGSHLVGQADRALYQGKAAGRNRVVSFARIQQEAVV